MVLIVSLLPIIKCKETYQLKYLEISYIKKEGMNMKSLESFINDTVGKKNALPSGMQRGQCVTLIQLYIHDCFGAVIKARGNAKDFGDTLVKEGLAKVVKEPRIGDIIVYKKEGKVNGVVYGHIAIYIDKETIYDQNDGYHDNYRAGYGKHLNSTETYYRMITKEDWSEGRYQLLVSKAIRQTPSLTNNIVLVGAVMPSKRNLLTSANVRAKAYYKVGVVLDITQLMMEKNGRIWGKTINTWVVLRNKDGSLQAKKI